MDFKLQFHTNFYINLDWFVELIILTTIGVILFIISKYVYSIIKELGAICLMHHSYYKISHTAGPIKIFNYRGISFLNWDINKTYVTLQTPKITIIL